MEELKNEEMVSDEEASLGDEVTLFSLNAEVKLLQKECEELKEEIKFLKSGSAPMQNQQIGKMASTVGIVIESLISGLCGGALLMLIIFFANKEQQAFKYTAGGLFLGAILMFAISRLTKAKNKIFLIINGILVFFVMMLYYVISVTGM